MNQTATKQRQERVKSILAELADDRHVSVSNRHFAAVRSAQRRRLAHISGLPLSQDQIIESTFAAKYFALEAIHG